MNIIHSREVNPMKHSLKPLTSIIVLFFVLGSLFISVFVESKLSQPVNENIISSEIVLLRGEHVLVLNASENVSSFSVKYVFPPDYLYQVPILFELVNDTTAHILKYGIENDMLPPNKIINFTLASMEKDESVTLHFYYWVLVNNHNYSDFPNDKKIPTVNELPPETRPWLVSTNVVQTQNILIKGRARQLQGFDTNLLDFTKKVAQFTRLHHYLSFLIQLKLGTFRSQDAVTVLLRNGECPGRSHLGCALFRASGVPARVIMVNTHYSFWYQMHFMTEYYFPGYGWISTETHKGITPYEPKNIIILRICSPEDENNTHTDYFYKKMTHEEYWFWIQNNHVTPYYADLDKGSKTNMFPEADITSDNQTAQTAFTLTQNIFHLYQNTMELNLSGENLSHFNNATHYQKEAINILQQTQDLTQYILKMTNALHEYQKIKS